MNNGKYTNIEEIREILENIYAHILHYKEYINNLNVFPVPDGDTGLNMTLTLQGALVNTKEIKNYLSSSEYIRDFARQMLLHSRGCSGVILALYCSGVAETLNDKESPVMNVYHSLENGYKRAYKGTTDPREGTILTLMHEFQLKYAELMESETDPAQIIKQSIPHLKDILQKTPDMLPVLKKAGVVDAGGAGFVILINGIAKEIGGKSLFASMLPISIILSINRLLKKYISKRSALLKGSSILKVLEGITQDKISNFKLRYIIDRIELFLNNNIQLYSKKHILSDLHELETSWNPQIKFRYCTEFVIESGKISSEQEISSLISSYGDSLITLRDGDTYKVHIHTNTPNELINSMSEYGNIVFTKIDDMEKQHRNFISEDTVNYEKEQSVFCIVSGSGFREILKDLGATDVFNYGRNKPSVNQLIREINRLKAKNVIAAPDDKDILMSLKYAASLSKSNVHIIESKSVVSLISMLMGSYHDLDIDRSAQLMIRKLPDIRYCRVARAARQAKTENGEIVEERDFFTLYNGTIIASNKKLKYLIKDSINMLKDRSELITMYKGIALKKKGRIAAEIKEQFSNLDVEEYYGGQYDCLYYITLE